MISTHRTADGHQHPTGDVRGSGAAAPPPPWQREVARLRAVQAAPFAIRFCVISTRRTAPPLATRASDGSYLIESLSLQRDLETLLMWAQDESVQLRELSAGPHHLVAAMVGAGSHHAVA